jgi:hypothetical protein
MTPIVGVKVLRQLGRSHGSHPVVGGIVRASHWSVSGWWVSYPLPPLCSVVLFVRRGTGMVSDQTEMTAVTSVLVRSEWRACSCQSKHARPSLDLSLSSLGVVAEERSRVLRVAKAGKRVVVDPSLGVGLACSSYLALGRSGHCWLLCCEPRGPTTNRCLETP